jgi:hypothetical protein
MTEPSPVSLSIKDPLSEVTRRERKVLLGVSAIAFVVTRTGLVPSKISALGVEFARADQQALLFVFALVIAYFVAAFAVYGAADYLSWRIAYDDARRLAFRNHHARLKAVSLASEHPTDEWIPKWPRRLTLFVSLTRGIFEFVLPLAVGAAAIFMLVTQATSPAA